MNYNQERYDSVLNEWKKNIIESIEDVFDDANDLIEEINDAENFSDLIVALTDREYWLLEDLEDLLFQFFTEVMK